MAGIKDIVRAMASEIEGVVFTGVAGMDGIAVAAHNPGGADADGFAAKFAMVMKLIDKTVKDFKGAGALEENLVQSQGAWFLTRYLTNGYYLGIAVTRDATLGNVRLVANKYVDQLKKAIG
jgi:predicted regulator of Ras-like GTPase activity (Roadblock/LC7/MglB family)